jgi:enoyl-CoA hydratase
MTFENLLIERDGAVAIITFNRPKVLNALNTQTLTELANAIAAFKADAGVRAVVITGSGEKSFVAGADINELAVQTPIEGKEHARRGQAIFDAIEQMGKPVIAAINGYALGGGCELALACTLRIAADTARIGQPEVNLGVLPGYGGTQRLPRLVGRGRALDLLLSGEPVDAAEAQQWGLVNRVVEQAELLDYSRSWLRKVLANAPLAVAMILKCVDVGLNASLDQGLEFEAAAFGLTTATEDRREGMQAFLEKRPACWKGR